MASLSGSILLDGGNGLSGGDDTLLQETWQVALFRQDGDGDLTPEYVVDTVNGEYNFTNVDQGQYIVRIIDANPNQTG
ncbi:MAG: hypothetical protein AB4372_35520 [Xenococcus sp. (in: cyanobacteria)]